jgi:hypothetical protein
MNFVAFYYGEVGSLFQHRLMDIDFAVDIPAQQPGIYHFIISGRYKVTGGDERGV